MRRIRRFHEPQRVEQVQVVEHGVQLQRAGFANSGRPWEGRALREGRMNALFACSGLANALIQTSDPRRWNCTQARASLACMNCR